MSIASSLAGITGIAYLANCHSRRLKGLSNLPLIYGDLLRVALYHYRRGERRFTGPANSRTLAELTDLGIIKRLAEKQAGEARYVFPLYIWRRLFRLHHQFEHWPIAIDAPFRLN
jgi:hypothetical protein